MRGGPSRAAPPQLYVRSRVPRPGAESPHACAGVVDDSYVVVVAGPVDAQNILNGFTLLLLTSCLLGVVVPAVMRPQPPWTDVESAAKIMGLSRVEDWLFGIAAALLVVGWLLLAYSFVELLGEARRRRISALQAVVGNASTHIRSTGGRLTRHRGVAVRLVRPSVRDISVRHRVGPCPRALGLRVGRHYLRT